MRRHRLLPIHFFYENAPIALAKKADGIIGMRINPDDEGSQITILFNGPVDPATLYLPRVAEKNNPIVAASTLLDYSNCSIRAPTCKSLAATITSAPASEGAPFFPCKLL